MSYELNLCIKFFSEGYFVQAVDMVSRLKQENEFSELVSFLNQEWDDSEKRIAFEQFNVDNSHLNNMLSMFYIKIMQHGLNRSHMTSFFERLSPESPLSTRLRMHMGLRDPNLLEECFHIPHIRQHLFDNIHEHDQPMRKPPYLQWHEECCSHDDIFSRYVLYTILDFQSHHARDIVASLRKPLADFPRLEWVLGIREPSTAEDAQWLSGYLIGGYVTAETGSAYKNYQEIPILL